MAKIVVKRQAAKTVDRQELYQALAQQLRTDDERKAFLAAVARVSGKTKVIAPVAPDVTIKRSTSNVGGKPIRPQTLERTTKILTKYIGPIAAVVVKKTAPTASDESDLYTRCAERITDEDERARFVAELTEV
jgi:serine/threonine-protein kinase